MLAFVLLTALLAIVAYGLATGGGVSRVVARRLPGNSRSARVAAFALGTAFAYGLSSLIALVAIGRLGAIATIPPELRDAAWTMGLPAALPVADLAWLAGSLGVGALIGVAILVVRRHLGKRPIGLTYRSPAAVQHQREWPAAAALAVSAGISEEFFFRLALPLLIAIVTGAPLTGVAVGLVAFAALHRHQGRVGILAVAIVGAALTYVYLLTGRLWVVMLLHVLIDLNALVLRPLLSPSAASPS